MRNLERWPLLLAAVGLLLMAAWRYAQSEATDDYAAGLAGAALVILGQWASVELYTLYRAAKRKDRADEPSD